MSASPCFLGVDVGTSGVRAAVIDSAGEVLARHGVPLAMDLSTPEDWWSAVAEAVTNLPAALRQRVQAVALDATSGTVLACDAALQPLALPLFYHQAPAQAQAQQVASVLGPDHVAASAGSSLSKALWLVAQTGMSTRMAWCLSQTDWLTARLRGAGLPPVTDRHNALKAGGDVVRALWPEAVRALVAWSGQWQLPAIHTPGERLGPLDPSVARAWGLSVSPQVAAGTTDATAAFIATGVSAQGEGVTSLGSTLVLKLLADAPITSTPHGVYSHWFGPRWLVGGASNAGGRVLRQFFSDAQMTALTPQLRPDQPTGLDYRPLPGVGERFPVADPTLLPRLEPRPADDAVFFQGLLESLARTEAEGYALLQRLGAPPVQKVWAVGGGARNPVYEHIRALALAVPAVAAMESDACVGVARLARQGPAVFA